MSGLVGCRRIVVVRALPGLGDMLCAVPALRSLRAGAPDAEITLVGLAGRRWFADLFPQYVDRWLELPYWPTIPEAGGSRDDVVQLLARHAGTFDMALQMQGSGGAINVFTALLSRGVVVAHTDREERVLVEAVAPAALTRPWPTQGHEIDRLLGLVRLTGAPVVDAELEFPVTAADEARLDQLLASTGVRGRFVVVHPGASRADRRWSPRGFAAVARHLRHSGLAVVVTGTTPERSSIDAVVDQVEGASAVVDPPLGVLAAVVRRADLLVSNDTGVAHLGVAVHTPSIVIGTTSDLDRWAPRDRRAHGVVRSTGRTDLDVQLVIAEAARLQARPGL